MLPHIYNYSTNSQQALPHSIPARAKPWLTWEIKLRFRTSSKSRVFSPSLPIYKYFQASTELTPEYYLCLGGVTTICLCVKHSAQPSPGTDLCPHSKHRANHHPVLNESGSNTTTCVERPRSLKYCACFFKEHMKLYICFSFLF